MSHAPVKLGLAFMAIVMSNAIAQSYPVKPVRMIVPFPPGGGVDVAARTFSQKYSEFWGQPVVIDNRPGAGGNIGAEAVAKSAPDGYNILVTTTGHAVAASLYKKLPFDPIKDFAPASQLVSTYLTLVAHPSMPGTLKELMGLAKAQPGKLNYGHTGLGVAPHLVGEMLKITAGVDFVMVTYKGDAQTVPAMMANEVQMGFSPPNSVVQLVKAGKLRAIVVSGAQRASIFPGTPTIGEAGYPEATYNGWVGLFAAGGTPRDVLNRVAEGTSRALKTTEVLAMLPNLGDAAGGSPDEFAKRYRDDIALYARVIKQANIPQVE
ncbi:MAG: Bug family tripartite tricarboxylate transporter substrate binding protein [Burkholderiales bacterium]